MCSFATKEVFGFSKEAGMAGDIYNADDIKELTSKEVMEILREDQFLEQVFGASSRLDS